MGTYYSAPLHTMVSSLQVLVDELSMKLFGKKGERVPPVLGRLVKLKEAAGKIRVIAIVDPFTN